MTEAFVYDGARTAFGRYGGCLSSVRPDDLLAHVIKTLVERNPFGPEVYEDVIAGCANQAGEDSRNVARLSGLLAGLPVEVGGITVNRLCASGLSAALDASRTVLCGEGDLFIAGGVESMSRAPFVLGKPVRAYDRTQTLYDTTLGARFANPKVVEQYGQFTMPETAEHVAVDLGITREESDRYAYSSQARYEAARSRGFFNGEIIPVEVPQGRKKDPLTVEADEHPRPDTSLEALARLRPLVENGGVTAGNASGINDGASAVIIGSESVGKQFGAAPRCRIVTGAIAGVAPSVMGLGPVSAAGKVMARSGLTLDDMDVIEINEAFAVQVLGCLKFLEIDFEDPRVNPNGGAIAVGHPLGASGARILITAFRQLEDIKGRYALVTMCVGIGQGAAVIIERI
jgi:3-oxoadipyl-CoA thiolase